MTRAQPAMAVKPLTKKQELAVQLMLDGYGKGEIQSKLNISQPTLYRWQQLPAWHEAVETAVRADTKTGEVQMKTLLPLATKTVHKLLVTGADNIKLGASRLVFETVAHMLQREEQQQMLQALEEQVSELRDAARERRLPESVIDAVEVELSSINEQGDSPVQACAPVITADTQAAATSSADAGSLIATGAATGQSGQIGHDSDPGLDKDAAQGALF